MCLSTNTLINQKNMNKKEIGDFGENIARNYLIKNGYKIINKNYRAGFDEIDIIAIEPGGTVVFMEVKTMTGGNGKSSGFMPEDKMTNFKLGKIVRGCQRFLAQNPEIVEDEKGWRIDLIAVVLETDKTGIMHHYKNL